MMRSGFAIFMIAGLATLATSSPLGTEPNLVRSIRSNTALYRLPHGIVPNHYSIDVIPIFNTDVFTFSGRVIIDIDVYTTTNNIFIHNHGLTITHAELAFHNGTVALPISVQSTDTIREFEILSFTSNIPIGNYSLSMSFDGILGTSMDGLYRSSYQQNGVTRWMVASLFQPTSARKAFPCFDEPGLKATFSVRIGHFANEVALFNTPVLSVSTPDIAIGNRVWTTFETTPLMSTYLLGFIVSQFESLRSTNGNFNVWARSEAVNTGAYALGVGQQIYTALQNNLNVSDPITKIDHVAVPDFSAGAMENWGLVLYREQLLLFQEGESTSVDQINIVAIIAHELAHNWFGNLVSPIWWNDLWFNEGFATYYQYHAPALVNTAWRMDEQFVVDQQLPTLLIDSMPRSRAMNTEVGDAASVLATFDSIAYGKSASVIRMLSRVMSQNHFTLALTNYLNATAFGVFNKDVLWSHMQTIANANGVVQNHIPLNDVFDSYVNQAGYPLVTVTRNYTTTVAIFSQERFHFNRRHASTNPEPQRWWVPITFALGTNPTRCNNAIVVPDWIRAQDEAIIISGFNAATWILENCQGMGYHRTNYDVQNWNLLSIFFNSTSHTQINPVNRAQLIDDSLNLARAGYINYTVALNLVRYLWRETDYIPWVAASHNFNYLTNILSGHVFYPYWTQFVKNMISDIYQTQGWDAAASETLVNRLHRRLILNLACTVDHADCRATAVQRFNQWLTSSQNRTIDPDLKETVYCYGIRAGTEANWNALWNRFLTTNLATEQAIILRALACTADDTILERYLWLSMTPNSGIRDQDRFSVFSAILTSNAENVEFVLDFVINNHVAISEFYGGMSTVSTMLRRIAFRIVKEHHLEKLTSFVATNNVGVDVSEFASSSNAEWIEDNALEIHTWLSTNLPVLPTISGATSITSSLFGVLLFVSITIHNQIIG